MIIRDFYTVLAIQGMRNFTQHQNHSNEQNSQQKKPAQVEFEKILQKEEKKLEKVLTNSTIDVII